MRAPCRAMKPKHLLIVFALGTAIIYLSAFHKTVFLKQFEYLAEVIMTADPRPVMTMRQNLTIFTNLSTGLIPSGENASIAEELFHSYASELQVICPESLRLGNKADGGWDVCIYSSYKPKQPCLVYSFGINNDWSFDDTVVATFNCTVRAFDPSMKIEDHRRGPNIWFYKKGISGSDFVNSNGWQLKTLETFIKMFNESEEMIDYLKIDVEYSEWTSLEAILNSTILSKVKQFGLETHTKEVTKKPSTTEDFIYYAELLRRIQSAGFYRWYWHYNHFGVFISKNSLQKLTCCYEMVFLNVNIPYVRN